MNNSNSISFNSLMDKINPLNFKENYNDCVIAFKVLLNLSNNDEIRNLGQQIIDSFLLLNMLASNSKLKKYFLEYSYLCDKLHIFINKYSQFEKLLRNNEVRTKAYLTVENNNRIDDIFNSTHVNIVIEDKSTEKDYSLNSIINSTNLFRIILCKDKEEKFKNKISTKIINENDTELKVCDDTKELLKRKKDNLVNTIISDEDISDTQSNLFNLIEEKFKELIYLEQKCYFLEKFIDETMTHLFVLDSKIAKIYADFKELCNKEYDNSIKQRQATVILLNNFFNEYEKKYKENTMNDNKYDISIISRFNYNDIYNEYTFNQKKEFNIIDFIEYIKYTFHDKNIDSIDDHSVVEEFEKVYAQFLIKKLGDKEKSFTFSDFMKNYYLENNNDLLLNKTKN